MTVFMTFIGDDYRDGESVLRRKVQIICQEVRSDLLQAPRGLSIHIDGVITVVNSMFFTRAGGQVASSA